ncbi:MAG TPA: endonuclease/exonuclease/phosphatase family protein [Capsulimonadaceae bacterium]|jgi:endonuclease/exonuclease/phosphatase family metal-dependent hydrolase
MRVRVLTYNIRHGLGSDGLQSLARIRDVIATSGADIVCLQEVYSGFGSKPNARQATWLAEQTGFHVAYADNWRLWPFRGMGNAILTRGADYSTWNNRLPSIREPRGLLQIQIGEQLAPITVLATHWGLHATERLKQSQRCAEVVLSLATPVIFCGDLNVTPDAPEIASLIEVSGLTDTWPGGPPTYAVSEPTARIDYVLTSRHWNVIHRERIQTHASDHFPVLVELELGDLGDPSASGGDPL